MAGPCECIALPQGGLGTEHGCQVPTHLGPKAMALEGNFWALPIIRSAHNYAPSSVLFVKLVPTAKHKRGKLQEHNIMFPFLIYIVVVIITREN